MKLINKIILRSIILKSCQDYLSGIILVGTESKTDQASVERMLQLCHIKMVYGHSKWKHSIKMEFFLIILELKKLKIWPGP